jgi:predicted dehydrogenase
MGVIGLGGISNVHIPGIVNSKAAELVAICDIKEDVLKEKGDKYNITENRRFTNYVDLINCNDVDAVSICTPNDSHFLIAMDSIRFNKPFALEKPITLTKAEAIQIYNAANIKKLPNMVCFSYRFKAAVRYARFLVQSGQLGEIHHVYAQYLQSWGNSSVPLVWRFNKAITGSGALGDLGSHALDLVRFITGQEIKKVIAHAGTIVKERMKLNSNEMGTVDVDDYCHYLAELENGISSTFEITRFGFGRGNYQRFEIYGTKGGLVYSLDNNGTGKDTLEFCYNGQLYQEVAIPEEFKVDQMQSFFDIINEKGDGLAANIKDGVMNQIVIDAILQSIDEERWIYIDNIINTKI